MTTSERRASARAALLVGSLAAVAGLVFASTNASDGDTTDEAAAVADHKPGQPSGGGEDGPPRRKIGEPCPEGGVLPSIAEVRGKSESPIYAPAVGKLTRATLCGDTPVLMYDDATIEVSYELGWANVDPAEKWKSLAAQVGGQIETIGDRPAYVRAAEADGQYGTVMLLSGDTLVRILGDRTVAMDRLREIAGSIKLP